MSGRLTSILACFVLLFSCSKKKNYEQVKIIGHAATGLEAINSVYHDNSLEGVEFTLSIEGCNGVEVDVQLSKDGDLWMYHDTHLDSETDGEGCISEKTNDYLAGLTYKTIHNEQLARLSSIEKSWLKGKTFILDLRHYNDCTATIWGPNVMIDALLEFKTNLPNDTELLCITGNSEWIVPLKNAGFSVLFSIYSYAESVSYSNSYPTLDGFCIRNSDLSKDEVQSIKNTGRKVYIFDVRSAKGIRKALKKYPDGIMSDDVRTAIIEKH